MCVVMYERLIFVEKYTNGGLSVFATVELFIPPGVCIFRNVIKILWQKNAEMNFPNRWFVKYRVRFTPCQILENLDLLEFASEIKSENCLESPGILFNISKQKKPI